jgi:uncharacterized protein (TIGR02453 family)
MLHPQTLEFLKWLEEFNDKKFFELYKPLYLKIKESFDNFIDVTITEISKFDDSLEWLKAKQCVYRIYKDQRFPKNREAPYKTNLWWFITPNGKKFNKAWYYIHIENNKCMICWWLARPEPKDMKNTRQAIFDNPTEFLKIINNKKFKKVFWWVYSIREPLKNLPKIDYSSQQNKEWELDIKQLAKIEKYLKYKDRLVDLPLSNKEILSPDFGEKIVEYCKILYPFVNFINENL